MSAPTRFWVPSVTELGPKSICSRVPLTPTLTRVPRGRFGSGFAMPQLYPPPGASSDWASGGTDHDGVGTGGYGFAEVSAGTYAAVCDDRDVASGAFEVFVAGGGGVHSGGYLRYADAGDFSGGAGGSGADSDEDAVYAGGHEFEGDFVADAVADDYGDVDKFEQFGESQTALALGYVARGGDGGLDDDDVGSGLGGERGELLGS